MDDASTQGLPSRALTLVIGALGGEGGGVLTDWVVKAAESQSFPVQSTSIPGVAQRTGATTYYVEIFPATHAQLAGRAPVMAMYATPGNMDIVVASELMEAGRLVETGMVTPDRTTIIASTHRVYSILEKSAMGDGLFDGSKIFAAAETLAKRRIMFDIARLAEDQGTVLNAIVLGLIAGSGVLPIPVSAFEESITSSGVAVESNLRGFRAGIAYLNGELTVEDKAPEKRSSKETLDSLLENAVTAFPAEAQTIVGDGVRRLVGYQGVRYARSYLDRLLPVVEADRNNGGAARGFELTRETARYLALMMSYEDIIRVAQLKSRPERMARVRDEVRAKPGEPLVVTEFLKPGWAEFTSVMPPWLGRPVMRWAEKTEGRRTFHFAMRVKTNSFFGYFRLWMLASLRWWRPFTYRFADERADIEQWLGLVCQAAERDYQLALEIAECANLRKGYSDTHARGIGNYRLIVDTLAVPAATGPGDAASAAQSIRAAREAALADPDGEALETTLARVAGPAAPAPTPPHRPEQSEGAAAAE